MRKLLLLSLLATAGAEETVLEHARREVLAELPPLVDVPLSPEEHKAQNARARQAARTMHMLDVPVRVASRAGVPLPGIAVRALHEAFDIAAPLVVTDVKGEAIVRLPRGAWRIDLVTHEPKPGGILFARVRGGVRDASPFRVTIDRLRVVGFKGAIGQARGAHVVTLAWPDHSFFRHVEMMQGQIAIATAGDAPILLQAVRRPAEHDPGYVLRRTIGPGRTIVATQKGGTTHTFTGKGVRTMHVHYESADALPVPLSFACKDKRSVVFDGPREVILQLDVGLPTGRYGFYKRPLKLDGAERTFRGLPPFQASVGYVLNSDGRYEAIRNGLSVRVFLLSPNGLMLRHDRGGLYTVAWEQVFAGRVLASGTTKPPGAFRTAPVDPKRLGDIRYRLSIRGPRENRRVEVTGHAYDALAKGGEIQTPCFSEVLPNAEKWASAVSLAARAYEETCPNRRNMTHIDRSIHMPGMLAGMGGGGGNRGWMWLPEGSVYGFVGPWYWTGLLSHELGHVYGYGHGNPAQTRIMGQAGRRAGRRLWAIRPGMARAPEGDRYRKLLEAVTRGDTSVEQSFDDARDIPVLRKTGEGHSAGDGVLTPNLEITGDDAVFLWYFRSVFGEKTDAARRKHAATWSWRLTLQGFSDPEIQIAMYSYGAGQSLAWLARMRGNMVYDHRIDAAMADLRKADTDKKFVWQRERGAAIHRWRTRRYAPGDDLAAEEQRMRAELGHRWWRFMALRELGREHFRRREWQLGERMLVKALVEARLGGEGMLKSALDETAPLWAAR